MEFNNKKLETTSKLINYTIATVLCIFLIFLTSKIMGDMSRWSTSPTQQQFKNSDLISENSRQRKILNDSISSFNSIKSEIKRDLKIAQANYENEKESFDNWLSTRQIVGSKTEDKEVIKRANKLDEYFETKQEYTVRLSNINKQISDISKEKTQYNNNIQNEDDRAYYEYLDANKQHDLNVFLIRLLVVLPILLLGIFFIMKFRKHKYWPLFLGYIMFSFYAFFVGLVPYLPSYGGYIRYIVGIVLSIVFGIYLINKIRNFIEKKKKELKVESTERAKNVKVETAEKALDNHMCPSCGKDFIMKKWDKTTGGKDKSSGYGVVTSFCRFCGLELFKKCEKCGTENFAHLPFCSCCGHNNSEK